MIKSILKIFGRLCLVFLVVAITYSMAYLAVSPGENYTKEYNIYQDVLDISSLSELKQYLDNNNISYSISKSTLKLTEFDNIEFIINTDNASGRIIHSKLLHQFTKLDAKDYDVISVKDITFENEITEKIYFKKGILTYSKINNNYYINETIIYASITILGLISSTLTCTNLIGDIIELIIEFIKKRTDAKTSCKKQ